MTTSIADLERIALGHWRPSTCEPLDTWVLRAHHGFTGRANSALALGIPVATPAVAAPGRVPSSSPDSALDPGLDQVREPALTRALDRVGAFYARRGLPARIAVPVPADCPAPVAGPPSTMPAEALAHLPEPEDAGEQLRLRYLLDRAGWLPTAGTSAFTMTLAPLNPGDCDLPPGYSLRGTRPVRVYQYNPLTNYLFELGWAFGAMFLACMICHGELTRLKPSPKHLTSFYMHISAGGALGGLFVSLVAPRLFARHSEWPGGLIAVFLLT